MSYNKTGTAVSYKKFYLSNYIYSLAGTGSTGSTGDAGNATSALLNSPKGISVDQYGNIFIADTNNNKIRFIPISSGSTWYGISGTVTAGYIYTLAGTGTAGSTGDAGAATSALLNSPTGIFVDSTGNVFIADTTNNKIRLIAKNTGTLYNVSMTANNIYTIVGTGTAGTTGDGTLASTATLNTPNGVFVDINGNIFIADTNNNKIRMVSKSGGTLYNIATTTNYIYTIAGTGTAGSTGDGTVATSATLNAPKGVWVDTTNSNLFIADTANSKIRFMPRNSGGTWYSISGTVTTGYIYTIAGGGAATGNATLATNVSLNPITSVSVDATGNIIITDSVNNSVRLISNVTGNINNYGYSGSVVKNYIYNITSTGGGSSGDNGPSTSALLNNPSNLFFEYFSSNIFIADTNNHKIRMIYNTRKSKVYTIAGVSTTTSGGFTGDGAAATSATLNNPKSICIDSIGNIFIGDFNNHRIRFIPIVSGGTWYGISGTVTAGYIYTVAGTGATTYNSTPGPATSANLKQPLASVDKYGNIFIADQNFVIRFIPKTSGGTWYGITGTVTAGYIYTIAGTGTSSTNSGDGAAATSTQLSPPNGVIVDSNGNVFISDQQSSRIRFLANGNYDANTYYGITTAMTQNYLYTVAGVISNAGNYLGDNGPATSATMNWQAQICLDRFENLFIAEMYNSCIRFVPKNNGGACYHLSSVTKGYIYTIAGVGNYTAGGGNSSAPDNKPATSGTIGGPVGIAVDICGNLILGDNSSFRVRFVSNSTGSYNGVGYNGVGMPIANNLYTLIGNGSQSLSGDNGYSTNGTCRYIYGVCTDNYGNIYFCDMNSNRIRVIMNNINNDYRYSIANSPIDILTPNSNYNINSYDAYMYSN